MFYKDRPVNKDKIRIVKDDGQPAAPFTREYIEANTIAILNDVGYAHHVCAHLYSKQIERYGEIVERYVLSIE